MSRIQGELLDSREQGGDRVVVKQAALTYLLHLEGEGGKEGGNTAVELLASFTDAAAA